MSTTFTALLDLCQLELGDVPGALWSRTDTVWPWCIEAMKIFPILRPMREDHIMAADGHSYDLASDFREVISVEYPISQTPPEYLSRMNELDPAFYSSAAKYDVIHNYADGSGYTLYLSDLILTGEHVVVNYLTSQQTSGMLDNSAVLVTVPDQYIHIIVAYVTAKAYRWSLGKNMVSPTAHSSIIAQMTDMVNKAEQRYNDLVGQVHQNLVNSRVTPKQQVDQYDRVY